MRLGSARPAIHLVPSVEGFVWSGCIAIAMVALVMAVPVHGAEEQWNMFQ